MEKAPPLQQPSYHAPKYLECAQKLADAFRRNEVDHTYAIMRMSYLLLRAHATWRDIGLSEKILRDRIEDGYLQEAKRHLGRARKYCMLYAAETKMAAWHVRRCLALANCVPHHIGTTKKELDDFTDGKPYRITEAKKIVLAFKKGEFYERDSREANILDLLRDPKKYPRKEIGVTETKLHTLALRKAKALLDELRETRGKSTNYRYISTNIWYIRQFLACINQNLEDIGTSDAELRELVYPSAYHKQRAEEALRIARESPSLYWLSEVRKHIRRAKTSLKELGTSRAELMEIRKKAPPRY
ncbi:MAG: hypothetical protein KIH65_001770 [Candidatus Uhrbacteria bacterium]|nr:hypothetical protein [Candidatus Uhrbacteria bacterium]